MKKILFLLFALTALAVLPVFEGAEASGSRGLPRENYAKPSKANDIGMIFYKLIGSKPSFASWIEASSVYKTLTPQQQEEFKAIEVAKLEQRFAALDLKKSAIIVRTAVKVTVVSTPSGVPGQPARQSLKLDIPPASEIFFPYTVGSQTIAVIPNGIELYRDIPLTANEAMAIKSRLDITGRVTLALELVPTLADGTKPIMLGGVSQWLLSSEIGFLGIYNNYAESLWSYQAPSYVMQGQDNLLKLKSNSLVPSKPSAEVAPQGAK